MPALRYAGMFSAVRFTAGWTGRRLVSLSAWTDGTTNEDLLDEGPNAIQPVIDHLLCAFVAAGIAEEQKQPCPIRAK